MLVLETFGPAFHLPDPSPFVTKALVLLKMSGLEYEARAGDPRKAPKGKMPVLYDDGEAIADTTFIRWHLEAAHGIDFDPGLSDEQKASGWLIEKALEDNLYWAIVHERWAVDENFDKGPRNFFNVAPAPLRPIIVSMVRRQVRKDLHSQGIGRHDRADIMRIGQKSLASVAALLGDKPFLLGDAPSGWDASAYAFVENALSDYFETDLRAAGEAHPNLPAYCARMSKRYFPEIER